MRSWAPGLNYATRFVCRSLGSSGGLHRGQRCGPPVHPGPASLLGWQRLHAANPRGKRPPYRPPGEPPFHRHGSSRRTTRPGNGLPPPRGPRTCIAPPRANRALTTGPSKSVSPQLGEPLQPSGPGAPRRPHHANPTGTLSLVVGILDVLRNHPPLALPGRDSPAGDEVVGTAA
jgi:hypothetical protein